MKNFGLALVCICLAATATAQVDRGKAWLEGRILNAQSDPPWDWPDYRGAMVALRPRHGKDIKTLVELDKGGYYSFRNVRPGTYELWISRSFIKVDGNWTQFKAQRVYNVVLRSNRRSVFNATIHPGKELEEIHQPTLLTVPFPRKR